MDCGLAQHEYLFPLEKPASVRSRRAATATPDGPLAPNLTLPQLLVIGPSKSKLSLAKIAKLCSLPGAESFGFYLAPALHAPLELVSWLHSEVAIAPLRVEPRGSPLGKSKLRHLSNIFLRRITTDLVRIPLPVKLSIGCGALVLTGYLTGLLPAVIWPRPGTAANPATARPWFGLNAGLQQRAAIDLHDAFRHGFEEWWSATDTPAQWFSDSLGFVHPGRMALYRPTLDLTDYLLEFDAEVDRQAIGFVFRASDFKNYQAVKLVVAQPGPQHRIEIVRYSVVDGHESKHTERPLPIAMRGDTTCHVRMEVSGNDFTLITQGKVADHWSDARLARGGVGFFCSRGDQARLGRVRVSHQNDALGKFCAYLFAQSRRISGHGG